MRALVIGGNGFIGSHLVDGLLKDGHSVHVLDKNQERFRPPLKDVVYFQASTDDEATLIAALNGVDIVYHLASTTVPGNSNQAPEFDISSNLLAFIK